MALSEIAGIKKKKIYRDTQTFRHRLHRNSKQQFGAKTCPDRMSYHFIYIAQFTK